ncbi:hypothetical protein [Streptomyces sp. NPDC047071]|uniref:hypothetical protein n=1 Tax=Streptomyces sp. NPDC047071 TaxID=3154808 RepID=UPI003452C788
MTEAAHGAAVGTKDTRLIVVRGNSASGKSSVTAGLRERFGRNLAIVGQDNLRRTVLRERDRPGGANIGLIDLTACYALDHGFHVVVEGIRRPGDRHRRGQPWTTRSRGSCARAAWTRYSRSTADIPRGPAEQGTTPPGLLSPDQKAQKAQTDRRTLT